MSYGMVGWWDDKEEPFENQVKILIQDVEKENLAFVMGDFNNNANIRNEGYDYICKHLFDTYNLAKER